MTRRRPWVVLLAENDHVIETLSAYGAHKAFSIGILPGRPRCCEHLVDADAAHAAARLFSVDAITIADQVLGRRVFGKCLDHLLGGPSRAGMLGNVEMKNTAPVVGQDEEDVDDAEGGGRHGQEVNRCQRPDVVLEEGSPGLRGWIAWPGRHEAGDAALADVDAELEQLAVDPGRAPAYVGLGHLENERLDLSARTRALNVDDLPVLRCTPAHQTIKAQPDYQRLWELSVGLAQGTFVREPPRW